MKPEHRAALLRSFASQIEEDLSVAGIYDWYAEKCLKVPAENLLASDIRDVKAVAKSVAKSIRARADRIGKKRGAYR